MNRLTQMGSATYAYDTSGNRTNRTDSGLTATYAWSSGNELTGVTHTPSGDGVTYRYDALGRRLQRVHTVAGSGTTTDEFVYDGLDLLAMNRGGAVYQQYVHGPGIDQPLALLDYSSGSLAVYYYQADRLGSIRALTDAAQAVAQSYTYTAFGVTTVGAPGGLDQPFRYTAREWDTAAGLYYYRARWYDPDAGRFVSPDPIGWGGGSMNHFVYVSNSPGRFADPSGLYPEDVDLVLNWLLAQRVVTEDPRLAVGTNLQAFSFSDWSLMPNSWLGFYNPLTAQSYINTDFLAGPLDWQQIEQLAHTILHEAQHPVVGPAFGRAHGTLDDYAWDVLGGLPLLGLVRAVWDGNPRYLPNGQPRPANNQGGQVNGLRGLGEGPQAACA